MTGRHTGNAEERSIPGRKPSENPNQKSGGPENQDKARQATADNDLTTGHTTAGDGGDNNAKR